MQQPMPGRAVPFPTTGIDPRVALASAVHAGPGIYAVVVGSGMSSAAGISTGWQIVQDLVRRIARAEGVDLEVTSEAPEDWWARQGRPELRYDTLLGALSTTDAARRVLLRSYFETRAVDGGLVEPTPAHEALATLVASARVRLVLTTNFDHLIERALERHGVTPQVIADPRAVRGMIPLTHAPATVVKLHGDYAMTGLRNTPAELASYPPAWRRLLTRIFDEYGLLVVGWSADYDIALVGALSAASSRRYPAFWTTFGGNLREPAARLVALRQATVVDTAGADEFLPDLVERVKRLDQIAARQRRPSRNRSRRYSPSDSSAPSGWAAIPLLQLRVACSMGPATADTTGPIMPQHRDRIVTTLNGAAVTARLRDLSVTGSASALAEQAGSPQTSFISWEPPPGSYQSMDLATYGLGGDATQGVAALVTIMLPGQPHGGVVAITLDLGISIVRPLLLYELVVLLRDAVVLATHDLPAALDEILPPTAVANEVEAYLMASGNDGAHNARPNSLLERVDLSTLGGPSKGLGNWMSFAAEIAEPLTEHVATELAVDAIQDMVLSNGFLDPRVGMAALRASLGLSAGAGLVDAHP